METLVDAPLYGWCLNSQPAASHIFLFSFFYLNMSAIILTHDSMSSMIGYPPTGCFDWSIDRACDLGSPHTISDDLRYHLIIQKFHHRATVIMSQNVSDPLGLPPDDQHSLLMKILEDDLGVLEGQIWRNLSRESHTALLTHFISQR
jgi:hypothetical protein